MFFGYCRFEPRKSPTYTAVGLSSLSTLRVAAARCNRLFLANDPSSIQVPPFKMLSGEEQKLRLTKTARSNYDRTNNMLLLYLVVVYLLRQQCINMVIEL